KYLAENEIAIGSMRRFVMSGFLGLAVASPICCGGFSMYRENHPRPGPEPASETLSVLGGILLVAACVTIILERFFRGGQVTIRRDGVAFRHRSNCVFVPWFAFHMSLPAFDKMTNGIQTTGFLAINGFVHSRRGMIIAWATQAGTWPLVVQEDRRVWFA